MTLAALATDTRETLRLEALRRRLVREHWQGTVPLHKRASIRLARWSMSAILLGVPLAVAIRPQSAKYVFLFTVSIAFWTGGLFRRRIAAMPDRHTASFGAFAMLHAPSRRALLVARWFRALPWLLWIGGCAVAYIVRRRLAVADAPVAGLCAIGLMPVLWYAFAMWRAVARDQDDWTMRGLGLAAAAAGALLLLVCALAGFLAAASGDRSGWFVAPLLVCLAVLLGFLSRRMFAEWRQRRGPRGAYLRPSVRVAAVLAGSACLMMMFWAVVEHRGEVDAVIRVHGWWAAPASLFVVLATGGFFVAEQLAWIDTAELGVFTRETPPPWKPTVGRARAGTAAPGAGLWRAQWRRLREEKLSALDSIVYVVISLRGPAFAAVAVTTAAYSVGLGLPWAIAAVTAPRLIDVEDAEIDRLQMFGRDLRDIVRHDLRALVFVAALPTLVAGVVAATIAGCTGPRIATLALIAAGFVLRAGMPGLNRIARRIGRFTAYGAMISWWIGASATIGWLAPTREIAIEEVFAVCIGVPGLLGIACGPLFTSESALRDERRRRAAGVATA